MGMKPCIICKEIKPLSEFYLQKGMKDGHLNKCKQCCIEQYHYRKEHNIHKITRPVKPTKKCYVCMVEKPLSEFYKQKGMVDGRLNKCIECCNNYSDNQRKTNPSYYMRAIYNGMKWRCQHLDRYKVLQILSKDEWVIWCSKNMNKFMRLYRKWQESGFDNKLSPSIDRIDNKLGYLSGNMQWLTQSENAKKGNK